MLARAPRGRVGIRVSRGAITAIGVSGEGIVRKLRLSAKHLQKMFALRAGEREGLTPALLAFRQQRRRQHALAIIVKQLLRCARGGARLSGYSVAEPPARAA